MSYGRLSRGRRADELDQLLARPEDKKVLADGEESRPLTGATWVPPEGTTTLSGLGIAAARAYLGRDAIVRDDPYFGRRGVIKKIIPDTAHGFLVAVHVYARDPNRISGRWEELHNAPPMARKFLPPNRVEIAR